MTMLVMMAVITEMMMIIIMVIMVIIMRKIVTISNTMHRSVLTKDIIIKLVTIKHIVNMIATIRIMNMVMLKKKIAITVHIQPLTVRTSIITMQHAIILHTQVQPAVIRRHIVLNQLYATINHIVQDHVHIQDITI